MAKGQKTCKHCDEINGCRAYQCKKCSEPFPNKHGRIRFSKSPIQNWRELKPDDCFRIVGGSGSYYEHPDTGERTYMSSRGKYKVNRVIRDGILVYGVGKHNTGCEFIYMGNENKSKLCDNLYNAPHKIIRIKNPRKV